MLRASIKRCQIVARTTSNDAYSAARTNANVADMHNGLNQLTATGGIAISHDARGNTTFDPQYSQWHGYSSENLLTTTGGPSWSGTLSWDPLQRLYEADSPAGTTRFLYDGQALLAEYGPVGNLLRRYVHGPGVDEPLVQYEGTGTSDRRFLHADERGSIVAVSNGSGATTALNRYDEYGMPTGGTFAGRFGYTGQTWLPELGMWHYKARIYNPNPDRAGGRFMQTDPIGYEDQINLYVSFGNDPINVLDPTGTASCGSRIEGVNNCSGISGLAFEEGRLSQRTQIARSSSLDIFNPGPVSCLICKIVHPIFIIIDFLGSHELADGMIRHPPAPPTMSEIRREIAAAGFVGRERNARFGRIVGWGTTNEGASTAVRNTDSMTSARAREILSQAGINPRLLALWVYRYHSRSENNQVAAARSRLLTSILIHGVLIP